MSVITVTELQAWDSSLTDNEKAQRSLDAAESMIATHLHVDGIAHILDEVRDYKLSYNRTTIPWGGKSLITTLKSVTIDGDDWTADVGASSWHLFVNVAGSYEEFPTDKLITVTVDSGWADKSSMPQFLQDAILNMAAHVYSVENRFREGRVQAEKIGDYSITYDTSQGGEIALPPKIAGMLIPLKRPLI